MNGTLSLVLDISLEIHLGVKRLRQRSPINQSCFVSVYPFKSLNSSLTLSLVVLKTSNDSLCEIWTFFPCSPLTHMEVFVLPFSFLPRKCFSSFRFAVQFIETSIRLRNKTFNSKLAVDYLSAFSPKKAFLRSFPDSETSESRERRNNFKLLLSKCAKYIFITIEQSLNRFFLSFFPLSVTIVFRWGRFFSNVTYRVLSSKTLIRSRIESKIANLSMIWPVIKSCHLRTSHFGLIANGWNPSSQRLLSPIITYFPNEIALWFFFSAFRHSKLLTFKWDFRFILPQFLPYQRFGFLLSRDATTVFENFQIFHSEKCLPTRHLAWRR